MAVRDKGIMATSSKRVRMNRYSWDVREKTLCLMRILCDVLETKQSSGDRRYVNGSDWEMVFAKFNEQMKDQPVANVFTLKNRLALLKIQFKDFQKIVEARRAAPNAVLDDDAWAKLTEKHPETQKWRFSDFEFNDAMTEYFTLTGLDENGVKDEAGDSEPAAAPQPSERVTRTAAAATNSAVSPTATAVVSPTEKDEQSASVAPIAATAAERAKSSVRQVAPRKRPAEAVPPEGVFRARRGGVVAVSMSELTEKPAPETSYEKAQHLIARLGLSVDDRVDAKLFLLNEQNLKAFLHMTETEQQAFLSRYCFGMRDRHGRWLPSPTAH
ncbi:hypothetical protein ATCC90586_006077 [Pythium insidiosum]|nr:hypothetical protein ATCC90586_006077 [Pythium insidiosum]